MNSVDIGKLLAAFKPRKTYNILKCKDESIVTVFEAKPWFGSFQRAKNIDDVKKAVLNRKKWVPTRFLNVPKEDAYLNLKNWYSALLNTWNALSDAEKDSYVLKLKIGDIHKCSKMLESAFNIVNALPKTPNDADMKILANKVLGGELEFGFYEINKNFEMNEYANHIMNILNPSKHDKLYAWDMKDCCS